MNFDWVITDIHAHVLPGLDDGPGTPKESNELLSQFLESGVQQVFCTSHYASPHFEVSLDDLARAFDTIARQGPSQHHSNFASDSAQIVRSNPRAPGVPSRLTLARGAEVRLSAGVVDPIKTRSVPTLGNTNYVLVEFPGDDIPRPALSLVHELMVRGYQPIMAHPERNLAVQKRPQWIPELLELGLLLQITASCLLKTGRDMHRADKLAWSLLENGQCSVVASDAHNVSSRPPNLVAAYEVISDRLGAYVARQLMDNANAIWNGAQTQPVFVEKPRRGLRKLFS
ncbi:hypothetical protein LLE49_20470 [Alicyclobacillus tolerans]|uniref:tyrosine-protein phosphatase n=1 Tax=Alicyclobacillus tolerans TaxID=90970 RepID=UPI001F187C75|nr:CpsB/CapC family capsule biosynthesis tyrosine phosphatase [Alicyclobacillus tolerans]MCF8567096.1 hypothetical protein [Alicyclobacillus tolerans]